MKRSFIIILTVFAVSMFSCKSSKRISKSAKTQEIEQGEQQIVSEIIGVDEFLNESFIRLGGVPPKFKGDSTGVEFGKWVASHTSYPAEAQKNSIQGRVFVEFIIDKDGSVIDAIVIRSIHELLDAEALRIVNLSPKWAPGYIQGHPVKVKYVFPFNFRL